MIKEVQKSALEAWRNKNFLKRNDRVWNESYLKGHHSECKRESNDLYKEAKESGVASEVLANILVTRSWCEYYFDKNGTTKTNTSYLSAKEGLEKSKNPVTRSQLFEVAGLTEAYIVDEKDEPAEPLFKHSVEEAEKTENRIRIGEAKNGFALYLISPKQKHYKEAIPLFEDVAQIQEEEKNKRGAGHAHSNLILCYNETKGFEKSIEEADKALKLYDDPNLNHSFSARFRKSLALRGLGKENKDKKYFDQALAIYEEHKILRNIDEKLTSEEKTRLIANEDKNIAATKLEIKYLDVI